MPTLSNGNVGYTVFGDTVFMNGLYNGRNGLSHRARIPNYANLQFIYDNNDLLNDISYTLNVKTGTFETVQKNNDIKLVHLNYPHRFYTRAIVNEVKLYRKNFNGTY